MLGLEVTAFDMLGCRLVAEVREDELTHKRTNAQSEEGEAEDSTVPVVLVLIYSCEGREEDVQVCVCNGYIDGYGEADIRLVKHLYGTRD